MESVEQLTYEMAGELQQFKTAAEQAARNLRGIVSQIVGELVLVQTATELVPPPLRLYDGRSCAPVYEWGQDPPPARPYGPYVATSTSPTLPPPGAPLQALQPCHLVTTDSDSDADWDDRLADWNLLD